MCIRLRLKVDGRGLKGMGFDKSFERQNHSRRKVEQNPDLDTKPGKGFSEKMDFGTLLAIFATDPWLLADDFWICRGYFLNSSEGMRIHPGVAQGFMEFFFLHLLCETLCDSGVRICATLANKINGQGSIM